MRRLNPHLQPGILVLSLCASFLAACSLGPAPAVIFTPQATLTPTETPTPEAIRENFDGERAYQDVRFQVDLGPRLPESTAHARFLEWATAELRNAGWEVEIQETSQMDHPVLNLVARWGSGAPWVVFGAHYDSRLLADRDPDPSKQNLPVPGGNDGASGAAVLLELARVLPGQISQPETPSPNIPRQIWLVFFDAEDNGRIPGWDWILGSKAFVAGLDGRPDAAVNLDMIGDSNLNIFQEQNSNPELTADIWQAAAELGYEAFLIPRAGSRILDDHVPFIEAGIPAVDLIDFDYPYWHTTDDTADKVSPASLQVIGDTLVAWIMKGPQFPYSVER